MTASITTIHVNDQWTLLQVRGDLDDADTAPIAGSAASERQHGGHLAIDLANAHHVPGSLPPALSGIDYVVVLTDNAQIADAFRAVGVAVYESLDDATGDIAPLLTDAGDPQTRGEAIADLGSAPFDAAGSD